MDADVQRFRKLAPFVGKVDRVELVSHPAFIIPAVLEGIPGTLLALSLTNAKVRIGTKTFDASPILVRIHRPQSGVIRNWMVPNS